MHTDPVAPVLTPWQHVAAKLGLTASALSARMGRHRSKVSRALRDDAGLISGRDQVLLMGIAKSLSIELTPSDLMPVAR